LGIPKATDDWRVLLADPDIHGLALAVPPSLQAEIALAAAQAGKHLFCEKPLALNVSQAQNILTAARQAKIVHAMDFMFPEIGAWQKARELLRSPALGRIRHAALTWRVETYAYRAKADGWKTCAGSGGGTLNNFGSHTFYYLEWLLGGIERVSARLAPREAEVEARVDAWVEFAAGFSGTLSIAADAFLGPGHRLEVYGDSGTMVLDNATADYARGFKLSLGTRASPRLAAIEAAEDDSHADGRVYPVSRIAGRFIEAIRSGQSVIPNLEHGLRAQLLLDTLRLADRSGSWQAVGAG
jgi:predicted dehydrogenase